MTTIDEKQLNIILENHKHWLNKDCDDWENMRANLSGVDLRGVDLRDLNLSGADLSYADIRYAKLIGIDLHHARIRGANLYGADLHGADLHGSTLYDADLHNVNLRCVNLICADIRCANLYCASLYGANLHSADLRCANLHSADLRCANLYGANMCDANLNNAEISGAHNVPYINMICPEEGAFIGWKKARLADKSVVIKLSIPASAKRSSATSRKCRCNKAKVLEIYNLDGTVAEERKCYSCYDKDFIYEVGKMVKVNDFDDDRWNECSQGIHFFINRQEAIKYMSR